uniref:Chemokine interleukin-8-like domain-containing protein n=1 Tax=Salarias fasciatus TaxID=181472 RepID=A0A672IMN1_SALFA
MTSSRVLVGTIVVLLAFLAATEGKLFFNMKTHFFCFVLEVFSTCFLLFLTVCCRFHTGMSLRRLRSLGVEMHCRCIQTESQPIGRHIEKVELIPANSHCEQMEIIATLKKNREEVCLDPEAHWVKRVIQKIMSSKRR